MTRITVAADGETITVHIPLVFKKRGGRKLVVTPDGAEWAPRPRVDNAKVKALAWAFRWRMLLDTGVDATLEDLVGAKGVAPSYVSRVRSASVYIIDRLPRRGASRPWDPLGIPVRSHSSLRADVVQFFAEPRIV
jgi:hypothetical protein